MPAADVSRSRSQSQSKDSESSLFTPVQGHSCCDYPTVLLANTAAHGDSLLTMAADRIPHMLDGQTRPRRAVAVAEGENERPGQELRPVAAIVS